mmetsp:Transcript_12812/g.30887  ORF Transcript_12812/g.30887 Transcript_12812/m.30887 type:complete len:287 (-) Transcript_12812:545-1405(-)
MPILFSSSRAHLWFWVSPLFLSHLAAWSRFAPSDQWCALPCAPPCAPCAWGVWTLGGFHLLLLYGGCLLSSHLSKDVPLLASVTSPSLNSCFSGLSGCSLRPFGLGLSSASLSGSVMYSTSFSALSSFLFAISCSLSRTLLLASSRRVTVSACLLHSLPCPFASCCLPSTASDASFLSAASSSLSLAITCARWLCLPPPAACPAPLFWALCCSLAACRSTAPPSLTSCCWSFSPCCRTRLCDRPRESLPAFPPPRSAAAVRGTACGVGGWRFPRSRSALLLAGCVL